MLATIYLYIAFREQNLYDAFVSYKNRFHGRRKMILDGGHRIKGTYVCIDSVN